MKTGKACSLDDVPIEFTCLLDFVTLHVVYLAFRDRLQGRDRDPQGRGRQLRRRGGPALLRLLSRGRRLEFYSVRALRRLRNLSGQLPLL